MAEQRSDQMLPAKENETQPKNPPDAMLSKPARRAAVWSYFVPVVVLFVVIGVALFYWSSRSLHSDARNTDSAEIGTVGRQDGGFDPRPKSNDTRDEIKFRGGDDFAPITKLADLRDATAASAAGKRVAFEGVKVDSASGNVLWTRDDDRKYAIVVPDGAPAVAAGATISVRGRVEPDEQGAPRIVADQIQVR